MTKVARPNFKKDPVISLKLTFDKVGRYVWHCHIMEHEDNEMMRPYHVGPIPPDAPAG